ncbi:enoyl-CoA hydratase/isomerase family protein [Paraburkholderia elongata]|uniref:Enoyl-CoA hydratase/isomerase family protein n=1 Tax=Paraburkholderia elongata TaxID=2675747 RepID=A0A972NKE6_9BURK|nr:enoyl-CoA hydratase/isomerase family protein [Paraburkholderia elongata]NPT55083.1 enoyl-CoA hydratase/isomerase family protein [Paraburkholderia elongata]
MDSLIESTRDADVSILTLRHAPYNLIGPELIEALSRSLDQAYDEGARAVVLRSGLRHFSAGAEMKMLEQMIATEGHSGLGFDPVGFLGKLERFPLPVIASIHGVCVGGGLELALACDYIVAAESARLGAVEVTLGLHPLMGGIQRFVQRAGTLRAKELAMLGRRYDAATFERWGLINLVVPADQLESATLAIAYELANGPTIAHAATKRLVQFAVSEGTEAADEAMAEIQKPLWTSTDVSTGLESYRTSGAGSARFVGR